MGEGEEAPDAAEFRRSQLEFKREQEAEQALYDALWRYQVRTLPELAVRLGVEVGLPLFAALGYGDITAEYWEKRQRDYTHSMRIGFMPPEFLSATHPTEPTVSPEESERLGRAWRKLNADLGRVMKPGNDPKKWINPEYARVYAEVWGLPLPDPEEIARIKREKAEQAALDAERYERQRLRANERARERRREKQAVRDASARAHNGAELGQGMP